MIFLMIRNKAQNDLAMAKRRSIGVLAGLLILVAPYQAGAQTGKWAPTENVELVVPTAAGSTMDLLARVIQNILQKNHLVDVSITVQAKPGAGGAVAWTYVSRKTGDGNYLAISGPTLLSNDIMHVGELHYTDVTPIAQLFTEYEVFAVKADGPIKSGGDLVAALKAAVPPSVGVAPGIGGSSHMALLKLANAAGVDTKHLTVVPFKGANESVNALLGGNIDVAIGTMSVLAPFVTSGKLRALALAAPKRLEDSQIPTWIEQGFDVVEGNWRGIVGPKDMTPAQNGFWQDRVAAMAKDETWRINLQRNDWDADFADSAGSKRFLEKRYQELAATLATLQVAK
jgi:putative tricarboxylic transport membrane protein